MVFKIASHENKRSVRNCDREKNEIAKRCWEAGHNFSWDQKEVVNRKSNCLKNPNHINKISCMLPERLPSNLW